MKKTKTTSLEKAYLTLTGTGTRDETVGKGGVWRERARARSMR
jgi:hypothetical protein